MKPLRAFTVRYTSPDGRRGEWLPATDDKFRTPREAMDFAAKELGSGYKVRSAYESESEKRRRERREAAIRADPTLLEREHYTARAEWIEANWAAFVADGLAKFRPLAQGGGKLPLSHRTAMQEIVHTIGSKAATVRSWYAWPPVNELGKCICRVVRLEKRAYCEVLRQLRRDGFK